MSKAPRFITLEGGDGSGKSTQIGRLVTELKARKIEAIATRVYGADGVFYTRVARERIDQFTKAGLDRLPICMAKTHLSLSDDVALTNAPTGFTVTVRDLRPYTGAGWIVALCGEMQTMPGLGRTPAAINVDLDEAGRIVGLF